MVKYKKSKKSKKKKPFRKFKNTFAYKVLKRLSGRSANPEFGKPAE